MSSYAAPWDTIFAAPTTRKVLLLTLSVEGADPTEPHKHLASSPTSFRFASAPRATVYDASLGYRLPFRPYIRSWPAIERVLVREERKAQISDVQIELSAGSGLARALFDAGRGMALTGRLDLWSPDTNLSSTTQSGISLQQTIPIAAGLCNISALPRLDGPVTLTLTDGDPDRTVSFPPAVFTFADFPRAPEGVLDKLYMTTITGPMPEDVLAIPIDVDPATGLCDRWFLCTPPLTTPPVRVRVAGLVVSPASWTVRTVTTASRMQYTEIHLATPISQDATVAVAGGTGLMTTNLILYLLAYAGYRVSEEAQGYLRHFSHLDFSALLNESGSVLDLIRNRFLPQTRLVGTFQHGEFHVIDIAHTTPTFDLTVGSGGLLFRLAEQPQLTNPQAVFNAFEVRCGRNHSASGANSTVPLVRVILDKDTGPAEYRDFLRHSEDLWRRREAPPIEAADLPVLYDLHRLPVASPGGEALAKLSARLFAFRHSLHAYQANWATGMRLKWGQYGYLTDPSVGFVRKPVRVVRWGLPAVGPQVAFQTDDALEG